MDLGTLILLAGLIFAGVYGVLIYNGLVALKHNVSRAWSNIDVLFKQRHDELPKLVEVCRQYMKYEQETLEKVIEAGSSVMRARLKEDMGALGWTETRLRVSLGNLFALVENYPDLKAESSFRHLQTRICQLESSIAGRRDVYNESVNLNNIRIGRFPDLLVARLVNFNPAELLEFSDEEKADVEVTHLFTA